MDEGEFDYELEDAGNDLFSGNHSRREALFLPFSESGREAKEKSRAERPRLFQGKEGDRMREGAPAEWNGHPWGQLCKTEFTIKLDGKTTTKITRNSAQSEWRENLCALEGSEAVRTLIDK